MINKKIVDVMVICPEPKPKPIAIDIKRYTNSSGSFIGVLNLTIDRAPTRPNDKAKEDLTINITKNVVDDNNGMIFEIWDLPVKVEDETS